MTPGENSFRVLKSQREREVRVQLFFLMTNMRLPLLIGRHEVTIKDRSHRYVSRITIGRACLP
jgi:hypothetical protein